MFEFLEVFSSAAVLIGVLGGLVLSMIILLILQARSSAMVDRLAAPAYEYVQQQAEKEAKKIINNAEAEARQIRQTAEQERSELLEVYQQHAEELQASYQAQLTEHTTQLEERLASLTEETLGVWQAASDAALEKQEALQTQVDKKMADLTETAQAEQSQLHQSVADATTEIKDTSSEALAQLGTVISSIESDTKEQLQAHSKAALAAVDAHIDEYQHTREGVVDRHIAQIVESVTKQVLRQELSAADHAELARQALVEAKQAGHVG